MGSKVKIKEKHFPKMRFHNITNLWTWWGPTRRQFAVDLCWVLVLFRQFLFAFVLQINIPFTVLLRSRLELD